MFEYINGVVTDVTPKNIVLENNNIGFYIIVPNPFNYKINEITKVFVYQYIRENEMTLYGFSKKEEKELFLKLISVSGIGPKSALSILATGSVNQICEAIESRNEIYLRKFPGIGPKASQQIILDLNGKVNFDLQVNFSSTKNDDVKEALLALGYSQKEINKVLPKLDNTLNEADSIKMALKLLTR